MKKRLLFIVLLAPLFTFAASENFVYFKNTSNLAFANPDSYSVTAVNNVNVSVTSGQGFSQQINTDSTGGNYV